MDAKQSELESAHLGRASSDEIRDDIRGTRREMDETLDELGERLHPRHLIEDVIDLFRGDSETGNASRKRIVHGTQRLGRSIGQQIREHPLPALLAGVAIARWIFESTEESEPGYRRQQSESWGREAGGADWKQRTQSAVGGMKDQVAGDASSMGDKVSGVASNLGEKVSGAASVAGEKISDTASMAGQRIAEAADAGWQRVREGGDALSRYSEEGRRIVNERASMIRDRFRETSEEFPLPVGGAFLAAGVLFGLLLPRTQKEDEWMGEVSDQLKDETRAGAEELIERGKLVAARTASSAMDEAQARGVSPSQLADKAGRVVSETLKTGKEKAREQGITPSDLKEKAGAVAKTAVETAQQQGRKEISGRIGQPQKPDRTGS